jgi:hypothetical protein
MNSLLKYIEDAVESGIDRVKIVVNGIVTAADAKTALREFRKTKNTRSGYWSFAEPFIPELHGENFVDADVVENDKTESAEEDVVSKKKKKTSEQSNES